MEVQGIVCSFENLQLIPPINYFEALIFEENGHFRNTYIGL